ncbi:hypothetical protein HK405_001868, partial [Cladochytrium tenue]
LNRSLLNLTLYQCSLGNHGAALLFDGLAENLTLEQLCLVGNGIGCDGGRALGRALVRNRALQSLDLYKNALGDEGTEAVFEALVAAVPTSALQSLRLTANGIGEHGLLAAARALPALELVHLDLAASRLTTAAVAALEAGADANTWTQRVLAVEASTALQRVARLNRHLMALRDDACRHLLERARALLRLTTAGVAPPLVAVLLLELLWRDCPVSLAAGQFAALRDAALDRRSIGRLCPLYPAADAIGAEPFTAW